jgi:hypothetical protein
VTTVRHATLRAVGLWAGPLYHLMERLSVDEPLAVAVGAELAGLELCRADTPAPLLELPAVAAVLAGQLGRRRETHVADMARESVPPYPPRSAAASGRRTSSAHREHRWPERSWITGVLGNQPAASAASPVPEFPSARIAASSARAGPATRLLRLPAKMPISRAARAGLEAPNGLARAAARARQEDALHQPLRLLSEGRTPPFAHLAGAAAGVDLKPAEAKSMPGEGTAGEAVSAAAQALARRIDGVFARIDARRLERRAVLPSHVQARASADMLSGAVVREAPISALGGDREGGAAGSYDQSFPRPPGLRGLAMLAERAGGRTGAPAHDASRARGRDASPIEPDAGGGAPVLEAGRDLETRVAELLRDAARRHGIEPRDAAP